MHISNSGNVKLLSHRISLFLHSSYQNTIVLSAASFLSVSGDHLCWPFLFLLPTKKASWVFPPQLFTDLTQGYSLNAHVCAEAAQPSALPGVPSVHQTLKPAFPFMSPPGVPCTTEKQHDWTATRERLLSPAVLLHLPFFNFITRNHQGASQAVLVVKNPPADTGDLRDTGSLPGWGRSPGKGHGNPLQCSCLGKPMDWGACQAILHGVTKCQTWLKQLGTHAQSPKLKSLGFFSGFSCVNVHLITGSEYATSFILNNSSF